VTVKIWPWTLTVPVRAEVVVLAATATDTVPLPEPLPPVMLVQLCDGAAVHEQPLAAVTVKLVLPPAAATLAEAGDRA
jgi:hypothetical protein